MNFPVSKVTRGKDESNYSSNIREDCDEDTQTGQAAQPADVAVDELKEREVYESLVDEIVSGLNYLSVAERNVELSKMCKVRIEIIEKEIRNVDLANLKKSQKTSGGNHRKVNENCQKFTGLL